MFSLNEVNVDLEMHLDIPFKRKENNSLYLNDSFIKFRPFFCNIYKK